MPKRLVSLARKADERMGHMDSALLQGEEYPPGLCLTLTDSELEKLSLSDEGVEVGDLVHLVVMVEVTSVHHDGSGCRLEARIIGGRVENESTEDEDDEDGE